jgi:hypothetical protein
MAEDEKALLAETLNEPTLSRRTTGRNISMLKSRHTLRGQSSMGLSALPQIEVEAPKEITPMTKNDLTRLSRAYKSKLIGFNYDDTNTDFADMCVDDDDSYSSPSALSSHAYTDRKRYAEDLLLLKEMKAGVLPEQLLKKIPNTANLITLDLSHFGIGDELGCCLGTR